MLGRTVAVGGVARCLAFAAGWRRRLRAASARSRPRDPTRLTAVQPATPALSPRNASYTITARLDPASRTHHGRADPDLAQHLDHPGHELRFHLYYNAWRNTRSTWMRERRARRGDPALARSPRSRLGLDRCRPASRSSARRRARRRHRRACASSPPTTATRTTGRCWRCRSTSPSRRAKPSTCRSPGPSRVPRTFARTGAIGNYYFLGAVVSEDRRAAGHRLELPPVPRRDRVLRGLRHLRRPADGAERLDRRRHRRRARHAATRATARRRIITTQEDVHDFAWTTSPDYVERIERVRASERCPRCRHAPAAAARARPARPTATSTPRARRSATTASGSVRTRTDTSPSSIPRGRAAPAAWSIRRSSPRARAGSRRAASPIPKGVTVHEAGHQFWYGIVATNEFEHAWMDEGFNTFSTARDDRRSSSNRSYYSKRYFGGFVPWVFARRAAQPRATDGNRLSGYPPGRDAADAPVDADVALLAGHGRSAITYNKTALWLNTLERMLGWDTLQRILSTYFARYAFKHPEPGGLLRGGERGQRAGSDVVLRSGLSQLERLRLRRRRVHERTRTARGFFGDSGQRAVLGRRARRRRLSHDARRSPLRRRHLPGRRPRRVRERAGTALAVGRHAIGGSCSRSTALCARSRPRSIPSACCCST